MIASRAIAVGAAAMLAGCLQGGPYACEDDAQCERPGSVGGSCEQGWCAYEDETCETSELRFSANAGEGLAGTCVDPAATTGDVVTAEGSGSSSSGDDPMPCDGGCSSPPGPCFEPNGTCESGSCVYAPADVGTACDDDDDCSITSSCDGEGACVPEEIVECEDPPSDCYAATGECDPIDGSCSYEMLDAGTACDDGDGCTEDDTCDAAGTCTPGPMCPDAGPCETASCMPGGICMYPAVADGTQCGALPRDRCCAGTCVDIASDVNNCGGCGITCDAGFGCDDVANTAGCDPAPSDTSGRCTCSGNVNCDPGQVCRTQEPYVNLCTPESADACPGIFVNIDFCPNYCAY